MAQLFSLEKVNYTPTFKLSVGCSGARVGGASPSKLPLRRRDSRVVSLYAATSAAISFPSSSIVRSSASKLLFRLKKVRSRHFLKPRCETSITGFDVVFPFSTAAAGFPNKPNASDCCCSSNQEGRKEGQLSVHRASGLGKRGSSLATAYLKSTAPSSSKFPIEVSAAAAPCSGEAAAVGSLGQSRRKAWSSACGAASLCRVFMSRSNFRR